MTSMLDEPTRMTFTTGHLHAMVDAGFFNPNDRVELIEGEIYVTPPPSKEHTTVSLRLEASLRSAVAPDYYVTSERPIEFSPGDLVTPDLFVLDCLPEAFVGYPPVEHVVLIVEIAKSSLAMDRGKKLERYARAGIPEYWVIDVPERTVEVYALPSGSRYRRIEPFGPDKVITDVPGASLGLRVADLFPAGIKWD